MSITNLILPVIHQNCQQQHCFISMLLSGHWISKNLYQWKVFIRMNHLTVKLDGLGLELSVMTQSFFSLSLPIIWDLPLSHKQAQSSHDHLSTLTSGKDPFDISDPYRMYDECLKWMEQWLHSPDREFYITLLTKHPTTKSEVQAILECGIVFFDPNSWQNLQHPSL